VTWEAQGFSLVSFGVVLLDELANFVNKLYFSFMKFLNSINLSEVL